MKLGTKILAGSVFVVVLVVGAAAIFLWSSLDSIVAGAIEKYGSEVTQTPVGVSGVKIGITSGEGAIEGLSIGNPKGFSAPSIFTLGKISTMIDTATVTKPTVVIKEIMVNAPKVYYEIDESGNSNIDALTNNIKAATSGGSGQSSDSGETPKLIIERLVIDKGSVDARIAALDDKPLSADLPRIELRNIGKSKGGATPGEISEQVVNELVKKARDAVASLGVEKYLGKTLEEAKAQIGAKVSEQLKGTTDESVGDAVKKGGDAIKGLFGK